MMQKGFLLFAGLFGFALSVQASQQHNNTGDIAGLSQLKEIIENSTGFTVTRTVALIALGVIGSFGVVDSLGRLEKGHRESGILEAVVSSSVFLGTGYFFNKFSNDYKGYLKQYFELMQNYLQNKNIVETN